MKKKCPICGKRYTGREVYCGRCGALLEIEPNHCSANKTEYCRSARLDPEDKYCPFCREPSTYALIDKGGEWQSVAAAAGDGGLRKKKNQMKPAGSGRPRLLFSCPRRAKPENTRKRRK